MLNSGKSSAELGQNLSNSENVTSGNIGQSLAIFKALFGTKNILGTRSESGPHVLGPRGVFTRVFPLRIPSGAKRGVYYVDLGESVQMII